MSEEEIRQLLAEEMESVLKEALIEHLETELLFLVPYLGEPVSVER